MIGLFIFGVLLIVISVAAALGNQPSSDSFRINEDGTHEPLLPPLR